MAKLSRGQAFPFLSVPPIFTWIPLQRHAPSYSRHRPAPLQLAYSSSTSHSTGISRPSRTRSIGSHRFEALRIKTGTEGESGEAPALYETRSSEQRARVNSCFVRFVFLTRVSVRCQETSMCILVSRGRDTRLFLAGMTRASGPRFQFFASSYFHSPFVTLTIRASRVRALLVPGTLEL